MPGPRPCPGCGVRLPADAPDSPEARRRFLREGRLAASVNHPNTVYVFGTDEIEGQPVIAMEHQLASSRDSIRSSIQLCAFRPQKVYWKESTFFF